MKQCRHRERYGGRRAALQCAIAYIWITEDLYDKEYVETHAIGMDCYCPQPAPEKLPSPFAAYDSFIWSDSSDTSMTSHHPPKTMVPQANLGHYTKENPLTWLGFLA